MRCFFFCFEVAGGLKCAANGSGGSRYTAMFLISIMQTWWYQEPVPMLYGYVLSFCTALTEELRQENTVLQDYLEKANEKIQVILQSLKNDCTCSWIGEVYGYKQTNWTSFGRYFGCYWMNWTKGPAFKLHNS